jgi:hypothetical protein
VALVVATLWGQNLHDLEHAAAPAAPVRSGRAVHRLPDLEPVAAHIVTKGFSPARYHENALWHARLFVNHIGQLRDISPLSAARVWQLRPPFSFNGYGLTPAPLSLCGARSMRAPRSHTQNQTTARLGAISAPT